MKGEEKWLRNLQRSLSSFRAAEQIFRLLLMQFAKIYNAMKIIAHIENDFKEKFIWDSEFEDKYSYNICELKYADKLHRIVPKKKNLNSNLL